MVEINQHTSALKTVQVHLVYYLFIDVSDQILNILRLYEQSEISKVHRHTLASL